MPATHDTNVEQTPMRATTIAEAVEERRNGPKPELTHADAFRIAKEEREKRELNGDDVAEAVRAGLPPPILEGDAYDMTSTELSEGETPSEDWMKPAIPEGLIMPAGWTVFVLRFRAGMTNTPSKGDRTCV